MGGRIESSKEEYITYLPSLESIPHKIKKYIQHGRDFEEVLALIQSDLSLVNDEIVYGTSYLIITNKRILVYNKESNEVNCDINLEDINCAEIRGYLGVLVLSVDTRCGRRSIFITSRSRKEELERAVMLINDLVFHKIPYNFVKKDIMAKKDSYPLSKKEKSFGALKTLFNFIKPYWYLIVLSTFISVLVTSVSLLPPYLMKILIDEILVPKKNVDKLVYVIFGLLAINASLMILNIVKRYVVLKMSQKVAFILRLELFKRIQKVTMDVLEKYRRGDIISRILDDVNRVLYFLTQGLSIIALDIAMIIFIGFILYSLNSVLMIIAITPVPVSVFGTFIYRKVMPRYYHKLWRKWSRIVSTLSESLSAHILIKTYGREEKIISRFIKSMNEYITTNVEVFKNEQKFGPVMSLTFTISNVIIWWYGGLQVLNGSLTLGSLTAFVNYMWMFYSPINELTTHLRLINQVGVASERIMEILSFEKKDEGTGIKVKIRGNIEFKNVWFTYDGVYYALKNISLKIREGEHIGIVGPSGSGKSTLIKLILGLYEPQRGEILIDGINMKALDPTYLKEQIAVVLQNPILFNGTIAENISFGKASASPEEIIAAAKAAKAHDFIMKLPEAYDTEVGSKGMRLSGGERQRIAIAAALLKDPKILILDEPTSALDAITEKEVTEAIENISKDRTTIIIAHRLSTLKNVDRIIVLENGTIVQEGTHDELIKRDGLYRKMFEAQITPFLERKVIIRR